jgi:hypothetical protein
LWDALTPRRSKCSHPEKEWRERKRLSYTRSPTLIRGTTVLGRSGYFQELAGWGGSVAICCNVENHRDKGVWAKTETPV